MNTMQLPVKAVLTGGFYIDAIRPSGRYLPEAVTRDNDRIKPWEMDGQLWTGQEYKAGTRKTAKRKANRILRRKVRLDLRTGSW